LSGEFPGMETQGSSYVSQVKKGMEKEKGVWVECRETGKTDLK